MAFPNKAVLFLAMALPARSVSIVRHEMAHVEFRVDAAGELVHMDKAVSPSMCNDDYPLGKEGTNTCSHIADSEILRQEMCLDAARKANTNPVASTFDLPTASTLFHPQGCFKIKCSEVHHAGVRNKFDTQAGDCFFYNPLGYKPSEGNLTGTPVCLRRKVATAKPQGTKANVAKEEVAKPDETKEEVEQIADDTKKMVDETEEADNTKQEVAEKQETANETAEENGGCPNNGYKVIMDQAECNDMAACLSYCIGAEYRVDLHNASKYNDYPKGCFIKDADGCVYFNQPPPNWSEDPTHPQGTSLCSVDIGGLKTVEMKTKTDATTVAEPEAAAAEGNGTDATAAATGNTTAE